MGPREEVESVGAPLMEAQAPRRGRPPRAETTGTERRRRQPGSLNRMVVSPLAIPEECRDPDYHYHWVNDVRGRVHALTTHDDYDIVTMDELDETARRNRADANLARDHLGSAGNVSVTVERDGTRAVLLKKRQSFYDHDYQEGLAERQAMMEGRVYHGVGESDAVDVGRESLDENTYVPKGNSLPTMRRKGPIPTRRL